MRYRSALRHPVRRRRRFKAGATQNQQDWRGEFFASAKLGADTRWPVQTAASISMTPRTPASGDRWRQRDRRMWGVTFVTGPRCGLPDFIALYDL
jgi:hypothetical protein